LKKLIKKNCVDIKKIKGNISKINESEFNIDKYKGKVVFTLISLKKSNSLNKFKIKTKPKIIKKIFIKDRRKVKIINLTYVFILFFKF
tara:strand:- start:515 stop:778 length:264 start_codon:yes stop_codon:yes gene_type:complete